MSFLRITNDSSVPTFETLSSFIRSSFTFSHYPIVQNTRLPTMKEEKEKVMERREGKSNGKKRRKKYKKVNRENKIELST